MAILKVIVSWKGYIAYLLVNKMLSTKLILTDADSFYNSMIKQIFCGSSWING